MSEDSDAEELTPAVELDVLRTIAMVGKDPAIYDKSRIFLKTVVMVMLRPGTLQRLLHQRMRLCASRMS